MVDDDDDDSGPLMEHRAFGAGIKRKRRINFVPAAITATAPATQHGLPGVSAGERYLSIVLNEGAFPKPPTAGSGESTPGKILAQKQPEGRKDVCEICKLPIVGSENAANATSSRPHEATLAHQVCLEHSYPPSHLDRNRKGMKYLSSYGWDPDSRLGLGATGEGLRFPIKPKVKNDTVGLGVRLPNGKGVLEEKPERLDAKQTRKREAEDTVKRKRLQEMFYQKDDVARYLGGD